MRVKLSQQEFEARARTEAILQQLVIACRQVGPLLSYLDYLFYLDQILPRLSLIWLVQVGELEKREVKASEEVASLRREVVFTFCSCT